MAAKSKVPTTRALRRMKTVAKLKVKGCGWKDIAKRLGYNSYASAYFAMTQAYPEAWKRVYRDALEELLEGVEAGALKVMDEIMNGDDQRLRQAAAHSLLNHTRQLRAQHVHVTGDLEHRLSNSTTAIITAALTGGFHDKGGKK